MKIENSDTLSLSTIHYSLSTLKIYCSGIGGIGLSAYAALQKQFGHEVCGSDRTQSALTDDLVTLGIEVFFEQDGLHVSGDIDLFVYSEAVPEDAPERVAASKFSLRQLNYFGALGELSQDYKTVAICGTHGKSSTTAMTAKALTDTGLDPTVVVGTKVPQLGGRNWRKGDSDLFVLEACEYRGSFFNLHPRIILLTNVEWDHVDAYPSSAAYEKAYIDFIAKLPEDGVLITHMSDPACAKVAAATGVTVLDADTLPLPELSIPGTHMQKNAQLVSALGKHLGVDVSSSLQGFTGTWRRFEEKGTHTSGAIIVDDYAHHPTEISATIASAHQKYPGRRIVCLFQPHMHDRTLQFFDDFAAAFHGAGAVWVSDVYEARKEISDQKSDIRLLTECIGETVGEAIYVGSVDAAEQFCSKNLQQSDVLLVMGAGDITNVANQLTVNS